MIQKILALTLAVSMTLSLTACGGSKPTPTNAPAPTASQAAPSPTAAEAGSFSTEQQASMDAFSALIDRFNAVGDTVNADENLSSIQTLVDTMNEVGTAIEGAKTVYEDPAELTSDVLTAMDDSIAQCNTFLDEVEAMVANYASQTTVTVPVEVVNDTGADIYGLAMSPSGDDSWGGDLLADGILSNGTSGVSEMTFTESSLVWDLLAVDSEGNTLTFQGIDFSQISTDGASLVLTVQDGSYVATFAE